MKDDIQTPMNEEKEIEKKNVSPEKDIKIENPPFIMGGPKQSLPNVNGLAHDPGSNNRFVPNLFLVAIFFFLILSF